MNARQQGVALVEALVAVCILGIGLVGVVMMQGRAYAALSEAGNRTEAALAVENLIGIASSDQANLSSYALAEGGTPSTQLEDWYDTTVAHIPGAVIRVDVTAAAGTTRTALNVVISWPRRGQSAATAHCTTTNPANTACNTHAVTAYVAQSE